MLGVEEGFGGRVVDLGFERVERLGRGGLLLLGLAYLLERRGCRIQKENMGGLILEGDKEQRKLLRRGG